MSETTLAALAAVGGPLLKEAEAALAPEAEVALRDLHAFVTGEADKLRAELPQVAENAAAHLHSLAEAMLGRYHSVLAHIEARLTGATPAAPAVVESNAESAAPVGPTQPAGGSVPETVSTSSASTDTTASATPSEPSSTDSASASGPTTDTPAA